jgi:two-component system LytT family response regulator
MADVAKGETFKRIALPMSEGLVFIEISDIVLFIAEGAYTNVYLNNGTKIMVSKPVRVFDQMLEGKQQFYRCHRSFLINLNYIKKYLKGESIIHFDNGEVAQVARDRKADFEGILKAKGISL